MGKLRVALLRRWRFARGWVRDGRPLWIWLAVAIVLLFGIPYVFPVAIFGVSAELSDRVRWSGMLFQFAGLGTVVWGLNRSRQLFERSSIWKAIWQWIGRLRYIVLPPNGVQRIVGMSATSATAFGVGAVLSKPSSGSIEERVAELEGKVRQLEKQVSDIGREVRKVQRETSGHVERERGEREAGDRKISIQLETATIGGIHLEIAGLAYLFVGIFLASAPRETACLLQTIGL